MLSLQNLKIALVENEKEIINNLSVDILEGKTYLLNGNNGSGKSTLVNSLMGNPQFIVKSGKISLPTSNYNDEILSNIDPEYLTNEEILLNELDTDLRSKLGLFLANQYPVEVPGVSLTSFLRLIYNSHRSQNEQMPVFKFKKLLEEKSALINYPKHLLSRNLNEGFSGGEKKKTEILQMLLLAPKYVFLDEIDSGLDRNSVKEVFEGIATFKKENPKTTLVIITHYDKVQEFLKPDYVLKMGGGFLIEQSNT